MLRDDRSYCFRFTWHNRGSFNFRRSHQQTWRKSRVSTNLQSSNPSYSAESLEVVSILLNKTKRQMDCSKQQLQFALVMERGSLDLNQREEQPRCFWTKVSYPKWISSTKRPTLTSRWFRAFSHHLMKALQRFHWALWIQLLSLRLDIARRRRLKYKLWMAQVLHVAFRFNLFFFILIQYQSIHKHGVILTTPTSPQKPICRCQRLSQICPASTPWHNSPVHSHWYHPQVQARPHQHAQTSSFIRLEGHFDHLAGRHRIQDLLHCLVQQGVEEVFPEREGSGRHREREFGVWGDERGVGGRRGPARGE